MTCLRTRHCSARGSTSRWGTCSAAQRLLWPNSSRTSLRTNYRYFSSRSAQCPREPPHLSPHIHTLQAHVKEKLDETRHSDVEQYLKNLYDLYTRYSVHCVFLLTNRCLLPLSHTFLSVHSRTTALATRLTEFNLGSDKHTFLSKLIKSIFSTYLESYIDMEREYLRNRGAMILQRYYDSKNHHKRPIGTGR